MSEDRDLSLRTRLISARLEAGRNDAPSVRYKTKIERVRGLDGAPRHQFLWDVTAAGGSKRVIGCGTVRTRSDALQKANETIERAERARLIRLRLMQALRALPLGDTAPM